MNKEIKKIAALLSNGRSFLFTIKSDKKIYQNINKIDKMISKISKTYIITRERNKKTAGYHFHAVFRADSAPKPGWFKKGIHMNLKEIGYKKDHKNTPPKKVPLILPSIPWEEISNIPDEEMRVRYINDYNNERLYQYFRNEMKKELKNRDINNVLCYICKEITQNSLQYRDYIVKLSNRNITF